MMAFTLPGETEATRKRSDVIYLLKRFLWLRIDYMRQRRLVKRLLQNLR